MSVVRVFLVIRADRDIRVAKRPRIMADEIAIPVWLDFPAGWGQILTDRRIDITVPDFTPEVRYEIEGGESS